jgi:hypothetical protein
MTDNTLAAALGQLGQGDEPDPIRCSEMIRADGGGWARCRRDAGGHDRHHVRGRSWETGGNMPRLDLGHICVDEGCCRWPEQVQPYLGFSPRAGDIKATRQPSRGAARK